MLEVESGNTFCKQPFCPSCTHGQYNTSNLRLIALLNLESYEPTPHSIIAEKFSRSRVWQLS